MPFLTEELWHRLFNKDNFLMLQKFTKFGSNSIYYQSQKNVSLILNIISSIRNLRSEINIPYKKSINLYIENKDIKKNDIIDDFSIEIKRLVKIDSIFFKSLEKKEKSAFIIIADTTLIIPLEGIIDTAKEITRLSKKMDSEKEKLSKIIDKLRNNKFIQNAPTDVIENFKIEQKNYESSIEKLKQIIDTIK